MKKNLSFLAALPLVLCASSETLTPTEGKAAAEQVLIALNDQVAKDETTSLKPTKIRAVEDSASKTKALFATVSYNYSNALAKNIKNSSDSATEYLSLKAGYDTDEYRIYAMYSGIEWKSAKANLYSIGADYKYTPNLLNTTLFAGAFAGSTNIKGDYSGSANKAHIGAEFGAIYSVSKNIKVELAYRYIDLMGIEVSGKNTRFGLKDSNTLQVGVGFYNIF